MTNDTYTITLPDGTTIEAPHAHEALGMALAYQNNTPNNLQDEVKQLQRELQEHTRKQRNPNLAR